MSPNLKIFYRLVFLLIVFLTVAYQASSQNFTTAAAGNWTTGANWSGGTAPPLTGQSWGTIEVNHDMSITGSYSLPGGTLNINAGRRVTISGNLTVGVGGGGNTVNVYGTLEIAGNVTLNSYFQIHPGGKVIIDGSVTVINSTYLNIGTAAAPPAYADLVIKQNLVSQTSGDITINRNGRVAIYGNVTNDTGGDTVITVNEGGQVYVHGNINLVGGGDDIHNHNAVEPYGLYVNGSVTSSGGGSTVDSNVGDQQDMFDTNPDFANWVATQSDSPLPVELSFFDASALQGSVDLNWATASQLNFDYFSVEFSMDGLLWDEIKRIKGKGTTQNKDVYNLKGVKSLVGTNYYRLKMVDLDGTFEYSRVAVVRIDEPKQLTVYPNPAKREGTALLELNFAPEEGDRILVYNIYGVEQLNLPVHSSKLHLPLSNFKAGAYLVKFSRSNSSFVYKLLVQ